MCPWPKESRHRAGGRTEAQQLASTPGTLTAGGAARCRPAAAAAAAAGPRRRPRAPQALQPRQRRASHVSASSWAMPQVDAWRSTTRHPAQQRSSPTRPGSGPGKRGRQQHRRGSWGGLPGDLQAPEVRRPGSGGSARPRRSPSTGADRRSAAVVPGVKKLDAKGLAVWGASLQRQVGRAGRRRQVGYGIVASTTGIGAQHTSLCMPSVR